MCKLNLHNCGGRIDPCMKEFINSLGILGIETLACCCGHGKYKMSVVVTDCINQPFDLISGKEIPRKKRFYKKDKQGYYYIPEVLNEKEI